MTDTRPARTGARDYPAAPWELRGQLHACVLFVRAGDLPVPPPPGTRLVRLGGRAVVGVAWVSYEPGSVLLYRELMATVLVRRGLRVRPSITAIWVDNAASRDGGRALWAIPKELARFDVTEPSTGASREQTWTATHGSGRIAGVTLRPGRPLPGRWPVRFSIVQSRAGRRVVSPVAARARLARSHATLTVEPTGPLGFLAGMQPRWTVSLRDFGMRFGRA